jgi:ADP-heptose:LPS heptosyltransferase
MRLKGLERWLKRVVTRVIAAFLPSDARGERPDWRERPYRVLFLRHDRIGDMILSTGILRAIAEAYPTIKLDVLASPLNAPVLKHEKYVNDVVVFDRKAPLTFPSAFAGLRKRRYDAVIDCMVTAPSLTTLLLMLASGARYRIGVASGNDFAYTLPVPPRKTADHIVDKLGALVTAFGLQPTGVDLRPRIQLTAEERARGERAWVGETEHRAPMGTRLLVNISAGRAHHHWPDERFVAVINAARAHAPNAEIVIVSSPGDRGRAVGIAAEAGARLVEDEGIRDAMAIVSAADVVFTPDTSISHVCSAFDKPAVVLHPLGFGPIWGPYGTAGRVVESLTPDVLGISSDEAARALVKQLDAVARPAFE